MYYRPKTLSELKENLSQIDTLGCFLSGCTDMVLHMKKHGSPKDLIDLSGVTDLKGITIDEDIYIGAGTTLTEIIESDILQVHAPILCQAADQVGSTQIRNAATIGGNVANAFAGADMIPPLFVLDAKVHILSTSKVRKMSIQEFILNNRVNALEIGEVILGLSFTPLAYKSYFGKIGSRSRVTISKLNMAAVVLLDDNKIKDIRLAFGALGTTAFREASLEAYFKGQTIDALKTDKFTQLVDERIPTRSSRHYKRHAIQALSHELYEELRGAYESRI